MVEVLAREEGIFPLDGTCGITLIYCDSWGFSMDDFTITSGKEAA